MLALSKPVLTALLLFCRPFLSRVWDIFCAIVLVIQEIFDDFLMLGLVGHVLDDVHPGADLIPGYVGSLVKSLAIGSHLIALPSMQSSGVVKNSALPWKKRYKVKIY